MWIASEIPTILQDIQQKKGNHGITEVGLRYYSPALFIIQFHLRLHLCLCFWYHLGHYLHMLHVEYKTEIGELFKVPEIIRSHWWDK